MFQFRKSTLQDMDQIVRIAEEGRALLKSRGISQWQTGSYPDRPLFTHSRNTSMRCHRAFLSSSDSRFLSR